MLKVTSMNDNRSFNFLLTREHNYRICTVTQNDNDLKTPSKLYLRGLEILDCLDMDWIVITGGELEEKFPK